MRLAGPCPPWALLLAVVLAGCQPSIGDSCHVHTDCSATGNRLCDPTLPGGYCTKFNCEPNKCPDEAVCVAFGTSSPTLDPACASSEQRFQRTFCMRKCSSDGDCRSGYACLDFSDPKNPWNATVVDSPSKVCGVPLTMANPPPQSTEVCIPPLDASFPVPPPPSDGGERTDASADAALDASLPPEADARAEAGAGGAPSGAGGAQSGTGGTRSGTGGTGAGGRPTDSGLVDAQGDR